jgi:hypothetical protein
MFSNNGTRPSDFYDYDGWVFDITYRNDKYTEFLSASHRYALGVAETTSGMRCDICIQSGYNGGNGGDVTLLSSTLNKAALITSEPGDFQFMTIGNEVHVRFVIDKTTGNIVVRNRDSDFSKVISILPSANDPQYKFYLCSGPEVTATYALGGIIREVYAYGYKCDTYPLFTEALL